MMNDICYGRRMCDIRIPKLTCGFELVVVRLVPAIHRDSHLFRRTECIMLHLLSDY